VFQNLKTITRFKRIAVFVFFALALNTGGNFRKIITGVKIITIGIKINKTFIAVV